jgi:hypothetical protein
MHTYEIRPRKDKRGVRLISDALPLVACGMGKSATQLDMRNFAADHMML